LQAAGASVSSPAAPAASVTAASLNTGSYPASSAPISPPPATSFPLGYQNSSANFTNNVYAAALVSAIASANDAESRLVVQSVTHTIFSRVLNQAWQQQLATVTSQLQMSLTALEVSRQDFNAAQAELQAARHQLQLLPDQMMAMLQEQMRRSMREGLVEVVRDALATPEPQPNHYIHEDAPATADSADGAHLPVAVFCQTSAEVDETVLAAPVSSAAAQTGLAAAENPTAVAGGEDNDDDVKTEETPASGLPEQVGVMEQAAVTQLEDEEGFVLVAAEPE
jgi:hypothetical protein